jgi:hypothetical protein
MNRVIRNRLALRRLIGLAMCGAVFAAGALVSAQHSISQSRAHDRDTQIIAGHLAPVGGGPGNAPIRKAGQHGPS